MVAIITPWKNKGCLSSQIFINSTNQQVKSNSKLKLPKGKPPNPSAISPIAPIIIGLKTMYPRSNKIIINQNRGKTTKLAKPAGNLINNAISANNINPTNDLLIGL